MTPARSASRSSGFSRREIPVPARTSQAWLRRFNSAFASRFSCLPHSRSFRPKDAVAHPKSQKHRVSDDKREEPHWDENRPILLEVTIPKRYSGMKPLPLNGDFRAGWIKSTKTGVTAYVLCQCRDITLRMLFSERGDCVDEHPVQ